MDDHFFRTSSSSVDGMCSPASFPIASSTSSITKVDSSSSIVSITFDVLLKSTAPSSSHTDRGRRRTRQKYFSSSSGGSTATSTIPFMNHLAPKTQATITTSATNQLASVGACCNGRFACGSFAANPCEVALAFKEAITAEEYIEYDEYDEYYEAYEGFEMETGDGDVDDEFHDCKDSADILVPSISRTLSISSLRAPTPSPPIQTIDPGHLTVPRPCRRRRSRNRIPRPRSASFNGSMSQSTYEDPDILGKLENKSRFYELKVECATCRRTGVGYPACGRCGEVWCSRECRIGNGGRHVCKGGRGGIGLRSCSS